MQYGIGPFQIWKSLARVTNLSLELPTFLFLSLDLSRCGKVLLELPTFLWHFNRTDYYADG